jgi:thiamine monophosphate kinase
VLEFEVLLLLADVMIGRMPTKTKLKPGDTVRVVGERGTSKIGLLVLHGGRDPTGQEIVPESWIRESTRPRVTAVDDKSCTINTTISGG